MTKVPHATELRVKIFADGADLDGIKALHGNPLIKGFTTNPTLMRKAGVENYEAFARDVLKVVTERPVSFEVFADAFDEMERQADEIASWGQNVFVKIPITNTKGESAASLIRALSQRNVQLNVTALLTLEQVRLVAKSLSPNVSAMVSVFAGRIADTGVDPMPVMREAVELLKARPKAELIWASPRELLNIFQADEVGCHIITVTHDVLKKLSLVGKDLGEYSLETVHMFHKDASAAGYSIKTASRKVAAAE
ncbi:MAG TPA: transaldolase [Alphaproteobacteria bacterium]|nr:transaldolase [Alphaproteobacteria bacterium]